MSYGEQVLWSLFLTLLYVKKGSHCHQRQLAYWFVYISIFQIFEDSSILYVSCVILEVPYKRAKRSKQHMLKFLRNESNCLVTVQRLLGIKMATFRLNLICRWTPDEFEIYREGLEESDIESS